MYRYHVSGCLSLGSVVTRLMYVNYFITAVPEIYW